MFIPINLPERRFLDNLRGSLYHRDMHSAIPAIIAIIKDLSPRE